MLLHLTPFGFVPIEKAHPLLPNASQCKVLLYLPPLGRNSKDILCPTNSTHQVPVWGVRVDLGYRKWSPVEISSPHSYSTSIHTIGLSCTVWPQHTRRLTERQTRDSVWNRSPCNNIGGLKTFHQFVTAKWWHFTQTGIRNVDGSIVRNAYASLSLGFRIKYLRCTITAVFCDAAGKKLYVINVERSWTQQSKECILC